MKELILIIYYIVFLSVFCVIYYSYKYWPEKSSIGPIIKKAKRQSPRRWEFSFDDENSFATYHTKIDGFQLKVIKLEKKDIETGTYFYFYKSSLIANKLVIESCAGKKAKKLYQEVEQSRKDQEQAILAFA